MLFKWDFKLGNAEHLKNHLLEVVFTILSLFQIVYCSFNCIVRIIIFLLTYILWIIRTKLTPWRPVKN